MNKAIRNISSAVMIVVVVTFWASILAAFAEPVDTYDLRLSLFVPRTYSNETSVGYRAYQRQTLHGEMLIDYGGDKPTVTVSNLVNRTHRIAGAPISYTCTVGSVFFPTRVNLIGSNATETFRKPSIIIYVDAEPSYSVGPDDEDNALLLTVAGTGYTADRRGSQRIVTLRGYAAGTLGCGCRAYGHVSPTRVAGPDGPTDTVDDVAAVFGTWAAKFKCRNGGNE